MGITYQIPHTSHYFTKTNIFNADFNVPAVGQYDFGVSANEDIEITDLQKNKVYLIDRVSIGGSISEATYLDAISTLPEFRLKYKIKKENVYFLPYSIVNYLDDSNITAWVVSEKGGKGGDSLRINVTGILDQTAELIGISAIKLHITFSIFIISNTKFYALFRDALSSQTGEQVTGSIDGQKLIKEVGQLVSVLRSRHGVR